VGDLARSTGLTVRTIHHYEAMGLLGSQARTDSGHRLYDGASVQRLYRIRVLRSLGVSLADIRLLLEKESSIASVLRQHLARVEEQAEGLISLRDRLRRICRREDSTLDANDVLQTIEAMSLLERHLDRRRVSTSTPLLSREAAWRQLGDELRVHMIAGDDPCSPRVRALATRARSLIHDFAAGDSAVVAALARVRTAAPPGNLAGWDPVLMRYLDRALHALEERTANDAE
jgi:DNA-binding transcriptional MerR regulator